MIYQDSSIKKNIARPGMLTHLNPFAQKNTDPKGPVLNRGRGCIIGVGGITDNRLITKSDANIP
jgi:hypothetical protein